MGVGVAGTVVGVAGVGVGVGVAGTVVGVAGIDVGAGVGGPVFGAAGVGVGAGVGGPVFGAAGVGVGVGVGGPVFGTAGIDVGAGVGGPVFGAAGVGVGVGTDAETVSLTITWIGVPVAPRFIVGVIVTAVLYTPDCKPVASAVNVSVEDAPGASLSLVEFTRSQPASAGIFSVHVRVPPPAFVMVIDCGRLISPVSA